MLVRRRLFQLLVGPRPLVPYEVEAYDIWHRRRLVYADHAGQYAPIRLSRSSSEHVPGNVLRDTIAPHLS